MKYSATFLALASASLVSAEALNRDFTVNLLTQVEDFSVSFPQFPDQLAVSHANATIKHVYDDVLYSVVGSLTFNETWAVQSYHLSSESEKWGVEIETTLQIAGEVKHLDLIISRNDTEGGFLRFDGLSVNASQVTFVSDPKAKVDQ